MRVHFMIILWWSVLGVRSEVRSQSTYTASLGLLAEYNQMFPATETHISDKYYIHDESGVHEGYRLGAFGQLRKGNSYWYGEASYFSNQFSLIFENLKPGEEPPEAYWTYNGSTYNNQMISLLAAGGFQVARHFPMDGGLSLTYVSNHEKEVFPDVYSPMDPLVMSQKVLFDFADELREFRVSFRMRVGYEFGPLTIRGTFERLLHSASRGVEHNGVEYPVKLNMTIWSFSLAYTVYTL